MPNTEFGSLIPPKTVFTRLAGRATAPLDPAEKRVRHAKSASGAPEVLFVEVRGGGRLPGVAARSGGASRG
eukprot:10803187-Alexandrium_andersonii.AAC.1